MPPSDSGARRCVSYCASIAASLAGWFSATMFAIQSPTPIWTGVAIAATVSGMQQAEAVVAVAAPAQHPHRVHGRDAEPGDHERGQPHVHELRPGGRARTSRPTGRRRRRCPSASSRKPVGLFIQAFAAMTKNAPATPGDDHRHGAEHVRPRRHAVPAEQVDADEDRLDEEREALQHEREAEHLAEAAPSVRARGCPSRTTAGCPTPRPPRTAHPSPWPRCARAR